MATVVLVASLLLVLAYWRTAQQRGMVNAEAEFQASSRQAVAMLEQRVINYELLVRGGASLQASLPQPSRSQWQRYVAGLVLSERFPAVQALGFALDVEPGQLGALQLALPGVAWGGADPVALASERLHAVVLYVAPEVGPNLKAAGVDLADDAARLRAMELSAARGELRMSEPVPPIVAAQGAQADEFALFGPVYASRDPGAAAPQPQVLRGWVFVQVKLKRFVSVALDELGRDDPMRIVDVTGDGQQRVLYADDAFAGLEAAGLPAAQRPAFTYNLPMEVMGRRWRVEFESAPLAEVRDGIPGLRATLISGLLGALLVFAIALGLARTQSRAQARATRMSASYQRSEQRFRSAMQYSAIGKALLDRDGRILDANPALAQILGTSQDALVGSLLGQHFVDGEHETVRTVEREALAGGGAFRTTRRLRRSDGGVRHASLVFASVPGEDGEEGFASLVQVEDVTERLRAEARIQALNRTLEARVALRTRELSHANQELEAFAYSVSHDLRAPLRSIDGFSRLLAERHRDAIGPDGVDHLQRIRNASARMSELIDALLKMSRVSRGELRHAEVDLSAVAREVVNDLRNGDPGREVAVDIQPGLRVHGDPALLRNLMENLLGNAWKFTRGVAGARIEVGRSGSGEFHVRDNGAGFDPEYASKLFRPFQRLHSEQEYAGHGIGLASVKRIVERHGGSIRAEGRPGHGATFRFFLPTERDPAQAGP